MVKMALPMMAAMMFLVSCGPQGKAPKVLVLYYSQTATTEALAQELRQKLGADIEKVVPVNPYDCSFDETVERGLKEIRSGKLPELQPLKSDLDKYDIIFLGYPIWFGNYALPMMSLLEQVDLSGRKVVPFCTFGSGGLVSSSESIAKKFPEAEVLPGYGVRSARIGSMPEEVDYFLKSNGYIKGKYVQLPPFSEERKVTEEEVAIFDAAVAGYDRIQAKAVKVASREIPGGTEYLFTARETPLDAVGETVYVEMKIYVKAEDGKTPEFTQVVR